MKNLSKRLLLLLLALVVVAAMTFSLVSCGNDTKKNDDTAPVSDSAEASDSEEASDSVSESADEPAPAEKTISVTVVDDKGESQVFLITTESETLADALLEEKLVEGEMGDYGLMITYVNGLRADYNEDGAYWAMLKDGEYMMTGASDTVIADGDQYELVYTPAQ